MIVDRPWCQQVRRRADQGRNLLCEGVAGTGGEGGVSSCTELKPDTCATSRERAVPPKFH